ncbi:MAG: asparagine synthase (glutamine-hydrolyzing) [Armatimonadota bacterium]
MCGICGFKGIEDKNLLYRMVNTLSHRGPDDEGFYFDAETGLGHKRLSIIDLATGHQPIVDERGRFVIVFNGEIYNYKELKKNLEDKGAGFKTNSDTEVVLYTYIAEGISGFCKLNGIWAFAIYDKLEEKLVLCRDHVGVKPLYYYYKDGKIIFASEMKAILEYKGYPKEVNLNAMDDYLSLRYVCGENTLFKGIKQIPYGHVLVYKDREMKITPYWDYDKFTDKNDLSAKDYREAEEIFHKKFSESVKAQLLSEVPLGAYLSGGVDSSLIAALMKQHSDKVVTFSVGFGSDIDETEQAYKVSKYLGTIHNSITVEEEDFLELPEAVWHLDQPVGDAIILAIYKLSSLASKHVKVVLTGEGADELFGGYVHQKALYKAVNMFKNMPSFSANALSTLIKLTPESLLNKLFNYPAKLGKEGKKRVSTFIKTLGSGNGFSDKYMSLATLFSQNDKILLYKDDMADKVKNNMFFSDSINSFFDIKGIDFLEKIMSFEYEYWLPDNILFKQDRLTMAHGLEGRVPYLDPGIISYVNGLPLDIKKETFNNKKMLKNTLKKYLPEDMLNTKKKAFHVPLETRFKKSFDNIINEYLSKGRIKRRNYFDYNYIQQLKENLPKSPFIITKKLMCLALLEIWHEVFDIG